MAVRADISKYIGEIREDYEVVGDGGRSERGNSLVILKCIHCGKLKTVTFSNFNNTNRTIGKCECQTIGQYIGQVYKGYKVVELVTDDALKIRGLPTFKLQCIYCGNYKYVLRSDVKAQRFKICTCTESQLAKKVTKIKYMRPFKDNIRDIAVNAFVSKREKDDNKISYVGLSTPQDIEAGIIWCKCNHCYNVSKVSKSEYELGNVVCDCDKDRTIMEVLNSMPSGITSFTYFKPYVFDVSTCVGKIIGTDIVIKDMGVFTLVECIYCHKQRKVNTIELFLAEERTFSFRKCECQKTDEDRQCANENYRGCVFGNLCVLGIGDTVYDYRVRCMLCNKEFVIKRADLWSGLQRSCNTPGCSDIRSKYGDIQYLNKIFNQLQVLDYLYEDGHRGKVFWECKCLSCNSTTVLAADAVASGRVHTCGCESYKYVMNYKVGQYIDNLKILDMFYYKGYAYWSIQCPYCDNVYVRKALDIVRGNVKSCGCITLSLGEKKIDNLLHELMLQSSNFMYKQQVTFDGLTGDSKKLRFDFGIYMNTVLLGLIEYDGEQHYRLDRQLYRGKDNRKSLEVFERVQRYDRLKNEYCRINNIPLLRIKYTINTSEIEESVIKFINEVGGNINVKV